MNRRTIATGKGDDGRSGLRGGSRVNKDDLRLEAIGALDEAHAFIGLARAETTVASVCEVLLSIQNHLYKLNAELASAVNALPLQTPQLTEKDLKRLEERMLALAEPLSLPNKFVLYGNSKVSAVMDVARAVVRRAERRLVALHRREPLGNPVILPYVNRLSDVLFILARYLEFLCAIPPQHPTEDAENQ